MSNNATVSRPKLTLPKAEAALLREAYAKADVILEYGSGGSTVMASEMPGKTVFSVESDRNWAQMMRDWLSANPPAEGTRVEMLWSNIGETKEWGYPVDDSQWRRFALYPLEVWQLPQFRQPDVVLVDGRFRHGCALATAFLTQKPVDLFVDDYSVRPRYRKMEEYLGTPTMTGRIAQFRVNPTPIMPAKLMQVIKFMQNP